MEPIRRKPERRSELLSISDLMELMQASRSTMLRVRRDPTFPAPVVLGTQLQRWRRVDVQRWLSLQRRAA